MADKELTPERIKKATELANKDRIIPSGDFIKDMARANQARGLKLSKKKLTPDKRRELLKPSERKEK